MHQHVYIFMQMSKEGSVFLQESLLEFFRLKFMLSWPVLMKFKQMLDQGNMLVFAVTVRWL